MLFYNFEFLPIVITALVATALINAWYSPVVLGRLWMTKDELEKEEDMVQVIHRMWMTMITYGLFFISTQFLLSVAQIAEIPRRYVMSAFILALLSFSIERSFHEGKTFWYIALSSLFTICVVASGIIIVTFWPW